MQRKLSAWGTQDVGCCTKEYIKTCPQCFLKALDSYLRRDCHTAVHILPLSYEGSAMWGLDHGYLGSRENPPTSLHGTDEADLHSAIKETHWAHVSPFQTTQGLQATQQTMPPNHSLRSPSPPTPTHPPSAEVLLPRPMQAFSWERTAPQPLSKLH